MSNIQTGNAAIDAKDTRGWLVGHFIDEKFGLRHSGDVETTKPATSAPNG